MAVNRRQFLIGGGLAAAAGAFGLSACGSDSGAGGSGGAADLAFTWWGNDVRNKNTTTAIDTYTKANPSVKISPQPGEWASYWDRLATQTAGNTAPDVIQMDMAYISEYGSRGALLDLQKYGVDVSKFTEGTVDSGRVDDKLVGVNGGVNTPTLLVNPAIFEKAKVELPNDSTWTWDSLMETAAEITAKAGGGVFGMTSPFNDVLLSAFLRQNGKALFTADGLGFEAADIVPWLDLMKKYADAKAIPSASQITEEATKPLDQGMLATGKAAMSQYWSNQVEAVNQAAGAEMEIFRYPSMTGKATDRKAWYKASMLWSASARSKNPEATAQLINWWVNSKECADANLAERGIPANGEIATYIEPKLSKTQQGVAKFITDIQPELSETPVAPLPGGGTLGDVLLRAQTDVLFGRASTSDAATKFVDEVKNNLTV